MTFTYFCLRCLYDRTPVGLQGRVYNNKESCFFFFFVIFFFAFLQRKSFIWSAQKHAEDKHPGNVHIYIYGFPVQCHVTQDGGNAGGGVPYLNPV